MRSNVRLELRVGLLVLGLVAGAGPVMAQEATLQQAQVHLQSQEWAEATAILEVVVGREPDNAQAWRMLGLSRHFAGEVESALEAHIRAAGFEETAGVGAYNAASALALLERWDEAFEWLEAARATGTVDLTQLLADSDFEPVHGDPRIAALLPTADEFADPFVESIDVLQEWRGEGTNDQFGWIARNVGDVDGDGIDDATASAPTRTVGGEPNAGKAYVFSSRTGELLWWREGNPGDRLGLGIDAAGDVDADGVPDVAVGAPGGDRVDVYSGVDGSTLLSVAARQAGEWIGRDAATMGDANGDGHDDFLVGAPRNDTTGENAGAAYVVSGRDGTILLELYGEAEGDGMGSSVGAGPSDGGPILVVASPNGGPGRRGRVYVYRGLTDQPAFVIEPDITGVSLGSHFVSVVGDIDGDGTPDVYASDWQDGSKGRGTGKIYVHSGADGRRLLTVGGEEAGEGFGIGPADAGDLNGDGHDDLVVGAWQHGSAAPAGGRIYTFSGRNGAPIWTLTNQVMGETLGFDATGLGDVDGDGVPDQLVTSAWSAINGGRSGRVFILSGAGPSVE